MTTTLRILLAAAVCVPLTGCGNDRTVTVPVAVRVLYKGQPAAGALVVFHPIDPGAEKRIGGKPFGKVKDDGTVAVTTHQEADGAPEGEYNVTVQWSEAAPAGKLSLTGEGGGAKDKLGGRYGDPRNPKFKLTVKRGDPNVLELKLD